MSYRRVNDLFRYKGRIYVVKLGSYDENDLRHCDNRCAFYNNQTECRKNIKITGDCQPKYRGDNTPVYFEIYGQKDKRKTVQKKC